MYREACVLIYWDLVIGDVFEFMVLSCSDFLEAVSFNSCAFIKDRSGCIAVRFGLGGRGVSDRAEQSAMIKPIDPVQNCNFHGLYARPGPLLPDHFSFVETGVRVGPRVVIAVADAAD